MTDGTYVTRTGERATVTTLDSGTRLIRFSSGRTIVV
jgi:hypothetical protein